MLEDKNHREQRLWTTDYSLDDKSSTRYACKANLSLYSNAFLCRVKLCRPQLDYLFPYNAHNDEIRPVIGVASTRWFEYLFALPHNVSVKLLAIIQTHFLPRAVQPITDEWQIDQLAFCSTAPHTRVRNTVCVSGDIGTASSSDVSPACA